MYRKIVLLSLPALFACGAIAQLTFDSTATAIQLARFLAGSGIAVSNAKLHCDGLSHGKFNGGSSVNLGIQDGVILSTGRIADISLPADGLGGFGSQPISSATGDSLDSDLAALATNNADHDACVLEFDMDVDGDSLKFNYVFGSEEYPEYVCGTVNDIFAFFLSGPKPGGGTYNKVNVAKIPGTNLPVTINSVNPGIPGGVGGGTCNGPNESLAYSNYYTDNAGNTGLAFDGITKRLRAIAPTIPCNTYHLKIAISDVGDEAFDSGVFLEARSISSTNVTIASGVSATFGFVNAVEGCNTSGFTFAIDRKLNHPFSLHYVIGGTATFGTDYSPVIDSVLFPTGDTVETVIINPLIDHLPEPNESVIIYLLNSCSGAAYDSAVIYIQDSVVAVAASPDDTICRGESTILLAQGANRFQWTPIAGLSNDSLPQVTASPVNSTRYYLRADVGSCYDIDSVNVVVTDAEFSIEAGPNDTICLNGATFLNLQISGNQSPYQILWTGAGLSDTAIVNPVAQPVVSTTYRVLVIGKNHCTLRDSLRVFISGVAPVVEITSDKNYVCLGDTIQLSTRIFPFNCGIAPNPCSGVVMQQKVGNGTVAFGSTPFESSYEGERIQMLYLASELTAAGVKAGTITDVGFDVTFNGSLGAPFNGLTMKMGCTDADKMTNAYLTGLSEVTPPSPFIIVGTGIFAVSLTNQYQWDGHSNLVIEICWDNGTSTTTNDDRVNSTFTSFPSVAVAEKFFGAVAGCNLTNPFASSYRPNVLFTYCEAAPKTYQTAWTPLDGIQSPDSVNTAVVLNHDQTYILNVSDSLCTGSGVIKLQQSRYGVDAIPDTGICAGNVVQLNVNVTGHPPLMDVSCGTGTLNCSGPPVSYVADSALFTTFYGPFTYSGEDSRTQILYRKDELIASGAKAGSISSIGFKVGSIFSLIEKYHNVNVKIGCTNEDTLDENVGWLPVTQVLSIDSFLPVTGWNDFVFTNRYNWDGSSNLVVEICWDNQDGFPIAGETELIGDFGSYNCMLLAENDGVHGCGLPPSQAFATDAKPMMRLNICPPPPAPVQYAWNQNTSLSSTVIPNPVASPLSGQQYQVAATFADGCTKYDTVIINAAPAITISVAFRDTTVILGDSVRLSVSTGTTGTLSYSWTPAIYLDKDSDALVTSKPLDSVLYRILVSNGFCNASDSIFVRVKTIHPDLDTFLFEMPDAFTPNGDGKNDLFFPVFKNGKMPPVKAFRIYNRWGELVFDNPLQGWDGRLNGVAQPGEQYTYFFSVELEAGKTENHVGNLTLLR